MKKLAWLGLLLTLTTAMFADMHQATAPTPAQIAAGKVKFLNLLLNLTTAQQDSATTLYTAAETSKVAVAADLETAEKALVKATLANDAAGMTAAVNTIGTDTSKLANLDAQANAAFNALLTADQKTKFADFLTADFDVPDHPGPGLGKGHGRGPAK